MKRRSVLTIVFGLLAAAESKSSKSSKSSKRSKSSKTTKKTTSKYSKKAPGFQYGCDKDDPHNFNICLILTNLGDVESYSPWMEVAHEAVAIWEGLIGKDTLTAFSIEDAESSFLYKDIKFRDFPDPPALIDDIVILITNEDVPSDKNEFILGFAKEPNNFTVQDTDKGDPRDVIYSKSCQVTIFVENIEKGNFSLLDLILHEIGHALGLGFETKRQVVVLPDNFIQDLPFGGTQVEVDFLIDENITDAYYNGTAAIAQWKKLGCSGNIPMDIGPTEFPSTDFQLLLYPGFPVPPLPSAFVHSKIPSERHTSEKCLLDELMTPGQDQDRGKISPITLGMLDDLGYAINYGEADPFGLDDLGDCGVYCAEASGSGSDSDSRRGLRSLKPGKPPIKRETLRKVFAWARESALMVTEDDEGVVTVVQDGYVYEVTVTQASIERFESQDASANIFESEFAGR